MPSSRSRLLSAFSILSTACNTTGDIANGQTDVSTGSAAPTSSTSDASAAETATSAHPTSGGDLSSSSSTVSGEPTAEASTTSMGGGETTGATTGGTTTGAEEPSPCDPTCLAGECSDVINVKTLGAVGDGKTDDYEAMLSVASYASAHPGVTLVFPQGTYRIDRYAIGGPNSNGVSHIQFSNLENVSIIGCDAKIDIKGDFHRPADYEAAGHKYSYSSSVIPFKFFSSVGFVLKGFEINGNVQFTTKDPGVVEGASYGIFTAASSSYNLSDLSVHHMGTDGILLGGVNATKTADKNVTVNSVMCSNNARQGMSVIQVQGLTVSDSQFLDTGRTEGMYGNHAPSAGVDVEPDLAPPDVDVRTGGIVFDNCNFSGNLGSQFVAAYANSTDDVLIKGSEFVASADSFKLAIILAVTNGEIRDSMIDTASGSVFPSWNGAPGTMTILDGCTIYSSGMGVTAEGKLPLIIRNSRLEGTHTSPYEGYMPYIKNTQCEFTNNEVFIPAAAHDGAGFHVISLLQNIALSSENHFSTDLIPIEGKYFGVSYNQSSVVNDHYDSGLAIRPYGVGAFDPDVPYSQN